MRLLEVEGLELRFGGLVAIQHLAFDLKQGELLAVVGPNGAGKTALLNSINGIYRPTAGSIRLENREIINVPLHKRAEAGVSRAFQHMELFGHLTVVENIMLGRYCHTKTGLLSNMFRLPTTRREEAIEREIAEDFIDYFELNRFRDQTIHDLPYGIQKVVGVARAVVSEPKLLLLDEPSTGLVREEKEHLARFIQRLRHDRAPGIIWIEHDMQMVADLADRVMVLNYGKKIAEGSPKQIRQNPDVIRSYLGST
jgi:branched-chain amino acid transport system ATP-binding protein